MKESDQLLQEGKFLCDSEKDKYKELSQYLILLSDDLFWQSRNKYFQILESFISRSIDVEELIKQFGQLRKENMKVYDMQKENLEAEACGILPKASEIDFQLNPQSGGFKKVISSLTSVVEAEMSLNSRKKFRRTLIKFTLKI